MGADLDRFDLEEEGPLEDERLVEGITFEKFDFLQFFEKFLLFFKKWWWWQGRREEGNTASLSSLCKKIYFFWTATGEIGLRGVFNLKLRRNGLQLGYPTLAVARSPTSSRPSFVSCVIKIG